MKRLPREKQAIADEVISRQERFWKISDAIWSFAELGLEEYRSSALLADSLEEDGFKVERGVAGMPTAFVGTWKNLPCRKQSLDGKECCGRRGTYARSH